MKLLRWCDLVVNGDRLEVRKMMEKTKREVLVPLSAGALRWLPAKCDAPEDGLVFDLPTEATAQRQVRGAAQKAGIRKHLTFHTSRHTFATSLFTRGADIYTTSKLLGHTNIRTTQIYANIVDQKKREAVDLLDGI